MASNLFQKVWDTHSLRQFANGQAQLFIGTHLIHEVTSPQAFGMLRELDLPVRFPHRTFATVDHIVPTDESSEPFSDVLADQMIKELRRNCDEFGITFFDLRSGGQGIIHVIGPEQGITQPGMTIACGDSHTSTHGAFGAIAFGVGTTQIRDILATQTLMMGKLKVRRINVDGLLGPGVYAKDVILHIIRTLGVNGGLGYAYEYGGDVIDRFSMDERMTVCNMTIEGGARCGYMNPDETTFKYLEKRPYSPSVEDWDKAKNHWLSLSSDPDCDYDDIVYVRGEDISPTVTWGFNPGQSMFIDEQIPDPQALPEGERSTAQEALNHMKLIPGSPIEGTRVDVAFIGSCTNSRLSDLKEVAQYLKGKKVASKVRALVVPGSEGVNAVAEELGIADVFREAGFEWRGAGCSMCLGMNPDKLVGDQICASSSNRNFKGRQGSPDGRTILMSPVMVAAAAVTGQVNDARKIFSL